MGFRRGILFGFFVGAIAVITSRRAQDEIDSPGTDANTQFKDLLDEARSAFAEESTRTEERLHRRFTDARDAGKLPPES
jgi:hypothetical protein